LIDNRLIHRKQRLFWDAWVVGMTGLVVLKQSLGRLMREGYRRVVLVGILRRYQEKRELERIKPQRGLVLFGAEGNGAGAAQLVDINEQAFLMRCDKDVNDPFPERFTFQIELRQLNGSLKRKTAICTGDLYRRRETADGKYDFVVKYVPATPLNGYVVHQYFLERSFV